MDALREQLMSEQDRTSKFKQLVIKEKKTNAHLSGEVRRLSSALEASNQQKRMLENELNKLKEEIAFFKSSALCLVQEWHASESVPELSDLKRKTPGNRSPILKGHALINQKNTTSALYEHARETFRNGMMPESNVADVFSLCDENEFFCNVNDDKVNSLYSDLKSYRSRNTFSQLKSQDYCSETVSHIAFENRGLLHKRCTQRHHCLCDSSLHRFHPRVLSLPSLDDSAYCFHWQPSLTPANCKWREILLSHLDPILSNIEDFGNRIPRDIFLLQCANLLERAAACHSHSKTTNDMRQVAAFPNSTGDHSMAFEVLSELWNTLFPDTSLNATEVYSTTTFQLVLNKVRELKTHVESLLCDHRTKDTQDYDSEKMSRLEARVHEMEIYASDQVDRAKSQLIELTQKIELQATDYDQLIRDKESEISELRELCDRLSEELAVYSNFWYSLMTFYCAVCPNLTPPESFVDWSSVASEFQANDFCMEAQELTRLLGAFSQELKLFLQGSANAPLTCDVATGNDPPFAEVVPNDVTAEHAVRNADEWRILQAQLIDLRTELSNTKKTSTEAMASSTEAQEKLLKQEEKIQRMKSMLLRLKQEESDHRVDLQRAQEDISRLQGELSVALEESNKLRSYKEQSEKAATSNLDEIFKLKSNILNLKEERDFAIDRFRKLQSDFSAYKIKAVNKLRAPAHEHQKSTCDSVNDDGNSDLVVSTEPIEVMQLKARLTTVERSADEAATRASLARTECELMREELSAVKQK
ncbi:unnamed protein product [Dicrocoelium dendriticum]|nr:unnamed protein product [Dicrocoelium dendriticum]